MHGSAKRYIYHRVTRRMSYVLEIPESFFKDEVRHGFLVPEEMKRAWASEMKVLDMLMDFCNKNDLRCFAEYGTLLGAVRHKGFIPWDDDIDVCMLRPDFNYLLEHYSLY